MPSMPSFGSDHVKRLAFYWLPFIGWMTFIFLLSNTTSSTLEDVREGLPYRILRALSKQEVVHTVEFAVLAALTYRLLFSHDVRKIGYLVAVSLLGAVAYGISDEIHQGFVAGRDSSLYDVGLDALGACLGTGVAATANYTIQTFRRRKEVGTITEPRGDQRRT